MINLADPAALFGSGVGTGQRDRARRKAGAALPSAHNTLQPKRSHQSLDRITGNGDLLSTELSPDLASTVDLEVLLRYSPSLRQ